MTIGQAIKILTILAAAGYAASAQAQHCHREGVDVSCDDGRRGVWSGDAIIWADGTRSRLSSSHPSVVIGNKSSVTVGPGVFVGQGKGMVPLDDPGKARCVALDDVTYCN
jgi:2-polyprenyl-6-methoxyphenol hydroxylase-like FAD-dependent oxidoreductase